MSTWYADAATVIWEVNKTLPDDITPEKRRKAIDAAYPYGRRSGWPYKAWLRARRDYLKRHNAYNGRTKPTDNGDLFR